MDNLNLALLATYAVDFIVIVLIFASLRWFSSLLAHTHLNEILAQQNNFAYGISLAGSLIAIAIMLTGAASGEPAATLQQEFITMLAYGLSGIALMWLTRQVFDHLALPNISISSLIAENNVTAGLIDAANMIASAIIIRAIMLWMEGDSLGGLLIVLLGFVLSQVVMILATFYRRWLFKRCHPDSDLQQQFSQGHIALAIRFVGHRIGLALSVAASSSLLTYQTEQMGLLLSLWLASALALTVLFTLFAWLIRYILLPGIAINEEVTEQGNIAIAAIQAAIYVSVGFLLQGLLAA